MTTQRIVYYEPLAFQLLGTDEADIGTYHDFCSAFDAIATACRARGQSFEKVYVDIPALLQWLRDNGHKNNNAGRAAFSETVHAIHPDIDYVPKKQSFAAANFNSILGPVNPFGRMNYAAMPHVDPFRR